MVQKYKFGSPFQTDAVVREVALSEGQMPYMKKEEGEKLSFSYHLAEEDEVYGLGENVRGINKRGWQYRSCCMDEPNHFEDKRSLYASHNFFVVRGKKCFGVFLDAPGIVTFDIGYTHLDEMTVTLEEPDAMVYVFGGGGGGGQRPGDCERISSTCGSELYSAEVGFRIPAESLELYDGR